MTSAAGKPFYRTTGSGPNVGTTVTIELIGTMSPRALRVRKLPMSSACWRNDASAWAKTL